MLCIQIYGKNDGGVCARKGGVAMAAQLQAVHIMGDVHLSRIPVRTGVMLMPHEERCGTR